MPEDVFRLPIRNLALTGHSGGEPGRHSGGDGGRVACSGHSPGWFWMPGGLAVDRPAPIYQGAALPSATGDKPHALPAMLNVGFPDGAWDPLLRAATIASGLSQYLPWKEMHKKLEDDLNEFFTKEGMENQLKHMWELKIIERPKRAAAIRAQAGDFTTYFGDLLGASPASRPNTWALILIGLQLAGLVTSRFKLVFKWPRPAQVWPAIEPMIDTPPHPAYPSGHAMQAWLIAGLMSRLVRPMEKVCDDIAQNIMENRVVAGVHWPADGEASKSVVRKITKCLSDLLETDVNQTGTKKRAAANPELSEFRSIYAAAKSEWNFTGYTPSKTTAKIQIDVPGVEAEPSSYADLVKFARSLQKDLMSSAEQTTKPK
jgi:hypothetical protein